MSAEKLLQVVKEKSKDKVAVIEKESAEGIAQLRGQIQRRTQNELDRMQKQWQQTHSEIMQKSMMMVNLAGQKAVLAEKRKVVDEVYEKAYVELKKMPEDQWIFWAKNKIIEMIETGDETIIVAKNQRKMLEGDLMTAINATCVQNGKRGAVVLSEEDAPFEDGWIIRSEYYDITASYHAMIQTAREQTEKDVVSLLFE